MQALKIHFSLLRLIIIVSVIVLVSPASAAVKARIGPYQVTLTTQPSKILLGSSTLHVQVSNSEGQSQQGLTISALTQMPGMPMGEKTEVARKGHSIGSYVIQANFGMSGTYFVNLDIKGPLGEARGRIPLTTGEDTALNTTSHSQNLPVIAVGLAAVVLVLVAFAAKRIPWKPLLRAGNLGAILVFVVVVLVARSILIHWKKPGTMNPLEAQTMRMTIPAPPGSFAVSAYKAENTALIPSIKVPGYVLAYNSVAIVARVPGQVMTMPFYPGDKVRKGEVLANLDVSSLAPAYSKAAAQFSQSLESIHGEKSLLAKAQEELKQDIANRQVAEEAVSESVAVASETQSSQLAAKAELQSAEAQLPMAQAAVKSAQSQLHYQTSVAARDSSLFSKGYISKNELELAQVAKSEAESQYESSVSQLSQVKALISSDSSKVARETSAIAAAQDGVRQNQAQVQSQIHKIRADEAAVSATSSAVHEALDGAKAASAQQSIASANLGYATILSPTDGVVAERVVAPGTLVQPGQTLLKVNSAGSLRVDFQVSSLTLQSLKIGENVQISYGSGLSLSAPISSLSPTADPVTHTGTVEAIVQQPHSGLHPGDFVEGTLFTGASTRSITIPLRAVVPAVGSEGSYVWIVGDDGFVKRSLVQLGTASGDWVQIISGVNSGDSVVVDGASELNAGDQVTVTHLSLSPPASSSAASSLDSAASEKKSNSAPALQNLAPIGSGGAAPPSKKKPSLTVLVTSSGFQPHVLEVPTGVTSIFFKRVTDTTCARAVLFPAENRSAALPLGKRVKVSLTGFPKGPISYVCNMHMLHGKLVRK